MSKTTQQNAFTLTLASFALILLVFFIFLNSIAERDKAKAAQVIKSLQKQFPSSDKATGARRDKAVELTPLCESIAQIRARYATLAERLQKSVLTASRRGDELLISSTTAALFEPQSDQLRAAVLQGLQELAAQTKDCAIRLSLEVKQSPEPAVSRLLMPPLELTAAQAASLSRLLIDMGFQPAKLHAAGLLEQAPQDAGSQSSSSSGAVSIVLSPADNDKENATS